MQLTKYSDLSLRVLMLLAVEPERQHTIASIARRYSASKNHLVKVVHQLSTLGYVRSSQGRGGGIRLGVPAEEIILGDVIRHMEKTMEPIDCRASSCPLLPVCLLKRALNRATDAFIDVLDGYSLADLTQNRTQLRRAMGLSAA